MESAEYKRHDNNDIELTKPLEVRIGKYEFDVPKGFVSDGASIPRFLWWLFTPFSPDTIDAAIPHDFVYRNQSWWARMGYNKKDADIMMNLIMIERKVSGWKRRWIYAGLRTFGWIGWNENKRKSKKK